MVLAVVTWLLATAPCRAAGAVPVPAFDGLVVDAAGALAAEDRDHLQRRLQALQDTGRGQVAILVVRTVDGESLADYALRVAEQWRLGRAGHDDGLLVVVVPTVPAARIEVGYGLEGAIPDLRAAQWLDELMPALREGRVAAGLDRLLDRIGDALPAEPAAAAEASDDPFAAHPEWKLPFVLVVFSPFALFPVFFGRWGGWVSSPLFAAMIGAAAAALWGTRDAALAAAAAALPWPLTWSLHHADDAQLGPVLRTARNAGSVVAAAVMFAVLTLFLGVGLKVAGDAYVPLAPLLAAPFALGVLAFLFEGRTRIAVMVLLRSLMHFLFFTAVAWVALQPVTTRPLALALGVAGGLTALVALSLALESRASRFAHFCYVLALVALLPLGLVALWFAAVGDDLAQRATLAAAGGGSIVGALVFALRHGVFAAAKLGLGGMFGGGGASRGG